MCEWIDLVTCRVSVALFVKAHERVSEIVTWAKYEQAPLVQPQHSGIKISQLIIIMAVKEMMMLMIIMTWIIEWHDIMMIHRNFDCGRIGNLGHLSEANTADSSLLIDLPFLEVWLYMINNLLDKLSEQRLLAFRYNFIFFSFCQGVISPPYRKWEVDMKLILSPIELLLNFYS